MAFSTVEVCGGAAARPFGMKACWVSSAIARVLGSFFRVKYSETPFDVQGCSARSTAGDGTGRSPRAHFGPGCRYRTGQPVQQAAVGQGGRLVHLWLAGQPG